MRHLNERERHRLGWYTPKEREVQRRLTRQQREQERLDAKKKPGQWP